MILDVGGLPLVIRTAKQALKSKAKDVIVATDHEDILNICRSYDVQVVMTKTTHNSGTDRLAEVVDILGFGNDEIIVNTQGDEPLVLPDLINQLANFIYEKNTYVATVAHSIFENAEIFNPNIVKVVLDCFDNALYFSRSAIPYYRDGFTSLEKFKLSDKLNILRHVGIYAYNVGFLKQYTQMPYCNLENVECLEQLRILYNGYKIAVLNTQLIPEHGVDSYDDLQRIRGAIDK